MPDHNPTEARSAADLSHVRVAAGPEGMEIHVAGARAGGYDLELLESMANCLVTCAEACMHETDPLRMLEKSLYSFAGHAKQNNCFERGFGLIPAAQSQAAKPPAARVEHPASQKRVTLTRNDAGVVAHVTGPLTNGCDAALCEGVLGTVLQTIEAHNCVSERGLLITKEFFDTIVTHTMQHNCVSRGLGLLPGRGAPVAAGA